MTTSVLKNPDISNITFKKPEKITSKVFIFNVKYNKTQNFIIQTPKFLVPYLPTIYCHKNMKFFKLCIEANNYLYNDSTKSFVKLIKNIDNLVKDKSSFFWKKCGFSDNKKTFVNSYNYNKDKSKVYFYFNLQVLNNNPEISIYDWEKKKRDYNYIVPHSSAYSLIWLQNIWLKTRKIGLNWVILQMKVYLPIYRIDECLIEDDEDDIEGTAIIAKRRIEAKESNEINETKVENENMLDHPIYGKFFKMKKFGIPIESIQHKLKMESLDPNIILKNSFDDNEVKIQNKPKNNTKKSSQCGLMGVLSGLGTVKLKKAKKSKKVKNKPTKNTNSNRPPTLEEILSRRNSLKKTNVKLK